MDDATALSERIARRELSCAELMAATLERIGRVNPGLNAIVSLREPEVLLAEAGERDAESARGERRGWMHGLPHAIKDLEEDGRDRHDERLAAVRGLRPRGGLRGRAADQGRRRDRDRQDQRARVRLRLADLQRGVRADPQPVRRLRRPPAGRAAEPRPRWPPACVPVADGSDYMGSLRNPAAFCNVYGFRPSIGRVLSPPYESAFEAVIGTAGPMARSARDLAALLATLAGPHPDVPFSIDEDPAGLAAPLEPPDPARIRIGWLGDLGGHLPFEDGILALCEAALARLGAHVDAVEPDFDPAEAWDAALTIRHYDATWLLELPRDRLKPELHYEADGAAAVTGPALHAAQRTRTSVAAALRALLREYDALALPSAQVFPFLCRDRLAARGRRAADADLPPLDGVHDLRLARGPARGRRPGRLRAAGAADGPAADRAPARRPGAAGAGGGLRGLESAMPELACTPCRPRTPATAEAALRLKGLAYERVDFAPGEHTAQMAESTARATPRCPGPLVDGEPVHGSGAIIERLEALDPEPALYPESIAVAVREAERWGDEELQDLGRRLPWGALHFRPEAMGTFGGAGPLDPAGTDFAIRFVRASWKYHRDHRRPARRGPRRPARQARPRRRARRGGHHRRRGPNAADLQIGATLRVLPTVGDLRPLIEGRAGERIARAASTTTRRDPGRGVPAGWVPSR